MPSYKGFSAWIEVNGKALTEYLRSPESDNQIGCWIESQPGQCFSVCWRDDGGKVDTCAFINVDGLLVPGKFLFGKGVASRHGVRTSKSTERPFMFQRVEHFAANDNATEEPGMIVLKIKRVIRGDARLPDEIQGVPMTDPRKRKAGDHCIGFGEEKVVRVQAPSTFTVKPYDSNGGDGNRIPTFVSFVFRYRSREFLEAQHIIPTSAPKARTQTPVSMKPPTRRVVSLPVVSDYASQDPAPPQPKKKPHLESRSPPVDDLRDPRRVTSLHIVPSTPMAYPGEGLLYFPGNLQQDFSLQPSDGSSREGSQTHCDF